MYDSEFLGDVQRNLAYWRVQIGALDDERIRQLSPRYTSFLWAVDLGIRCRQTRVQAAELILVAFLWIERERHEQDWLPIMQRLLQTAEIKQKPALQTQLRIHQGILLRLNAQLEEATAVHQHTLATLDPTAEPLTGAFVHFHLSEDYRRQHQITQAMHHATQAQQLLTQQRDNILYANTINTLGLLHLDAGELVQAAIYFQEALGLEQKISQPTRLARVLNNLALTSKRQHQYDLALSYYAQSLDALKETSNIIDRVGANINQGSLFFDLQNLGAAETAFYFAQSLLVHNRGWHFFEAIIEMNLGKVAQARQQYDQAMSQFKRSEILLQQVGAAINLGNVRGAIAEVYAAQGDITAAQHYYTLAIENLTPHADHAWGQALLQEFALAQQTLIDQNGS